MANPTNYYVDPAIAGNSGTGSIGDPFGDLQYALNTVTRDATNGDQFNIKAGTDEVLAAALDLSTYGTPALAAPLVFRGYTATANDGGQGGISGGGSVAVMDDVAIDYVSFIDLHLHNCGSNFIIRLDTYIFILHCELNNTSGVGVDIDSGGIDGCYFHDIGGTGILLVDNGAITNCFFKNGTKSFAFAINMTAANSVVARNIISVSGATNGLNIGDIGVAAYNNSIYSSAGTGYGIRVDSKYFTSVINNIVEGFSGVGGVGCTATATSSLIEYGHNKYYNNTTNEALSGAIINNYGDNDVLLASPFTNPADDDFSVSTAVKATAYPSSFYGSNTNNYLDPGAAQRQEAGGGPVAGNMRGGFING